MVNYNDVRMPVKQESVVIDFNNHKIHVVKNLSSKDKYDLIMITLQKAKEDGYYNPIKMDIFFHLHLVYLYTDIEFSNEDRNDELALYDELVWSGFMKVFLSALDEDEYTDLLDKLDTLSKDITNYERTAAALMRTLVTDLPTNAEAAMKIVDSFDPKKYDEVVKFAEAANGGRPISNASKIQRPVKKVMTT